MPGLLAFHAHPDDESISMGGAMTALAAAGEQVVVVTATRGEVGQIYNRDDAEEIRPVLGDVREQELADACDILGITGYELLGYRDSGMMGTEENDHPGCFWRSDFMEAVGRAVRHVRSYTPEVITAYDPYGGYGHPDHINTHRVGTAAFFGATDVGRFPADEYGDPWQPSKLYWSTWPRSRARLARQRAVAAGEITPEEAAREPEFGTPDEHITTWVDVREHVETKFAAILAHHTQIAPDSWFRTLPDELRVEGFGRETFVRIVSRVTAPEGETDLFAGLR
jgi:N-acetyl-1-D-myo-inositol-2-amino-2-deoxy-alpha-D-glucopyranoside deacetylase